MYDPSTGRCLESDPIGLKGVVNTYGYVLDNPLSLIDLYGQDAVDAIAAACNKRNSDCPQIEAQINAVATEHSGRYVSMLRDHWDLYNKASDKPRLGKRKGSWVGHMDAFRNNQA